MASSTAVARDELAQATATSKESTSVAAKTAAAKQVKHADRKAMSSSSKTDSSTVVANTN
jgi:hypothetical protein